MSCITLDFPVTLDGKFSSERVVYLIGTGQYPTANMISGCEISCSHGGEYEVHICLLGCTAV
jgi:hypothetical protein